MNLIKDIFLLKEFNTTDVCDVTHWWKILLRFDEERIEITLTQQPNPQIQTLSANVPQLLSIAKSWFFNKTSQNWTVKNLGGDYFGRFFILTLHFLCIKCSTDSK